jgi:hypothetical protein
MNKIRARRRENVDSILSGTKGVTVSCPQLPDRCRGPCGSYSYLTASCFLRGSKTQGVTLNSLYRRKAEACYTSAERLSFTSTNTACIRQLGNESDLQKKKKTRCKISGFRSVTSWKSEGLSTRTGNFCACTVFSKNYKVVQIWPGFVFVFFFFFENHNCQTLTCTCQSSTYSPPESTHFFQRSGNILIPFSKKACGWRRIHSQTV